MIATVKVKEIVFLSDKYSDTVENQIAKRIFDMSGIKYREMKLRKDIVTDLTKYFSSVIEQS